MGVGNELTDLPLADLLVVFTMIAQTAALKRAKVANNQLLVGEFGNDNVGTELQTGNGTRIDVVEFPLPN